jgi:poly(beta-D-mannuronate) lyase
MRSLLAFTILLIFTSSIAIAHTYQVSSEEEFKLLIPKIAAGDEVIITDGIYPNWSIEISAKGTDTAPITIRPENEGKVIFSGDINQAIFKLTGAYIILKGIRFENCTLVRSSGLLLINNATNCTVTQCSFLANTAKVQYTPLVIFAGYGNANQITHCNFNGNIDNQDIQVKITKEYSPLYTLIEHNLFENKRKVSWKNNNGGECIQIGQDPVMLGNSVSKSTIRFNKFVACNGEGEIISNKSSNNLYYKNNFEANDGELVMRGGHDCTIEANIFNGGTGGIRINGTGHKVINNQLNNIKTAIRLMYGMAKGKSDIGFYVAASDCVIANNLITQAHIGILVGDSKNADWTGKFDTLRYPSPVIQNIAPFNNKISRNRFVTTAQKLVTF